MLSFTACMTFMYLFYSDNNQNVSLMEQWLPRNISYRPTQPTAIDAPRALIIHAVGAVAAFNNKGQSWSGILNHLPPSPVIYFQRHFMEVDIAGFYRAGTTSYVKFGARAAKKSK